MYSGTLNFMGSALTCALSAGFQRCECIIGTRHKQANRKAKFELSFSLHFFLVASTAHLLRPLLK
jgi:hypothetical protein